MKIAFDYQSVRNFDTDGRLHVAKTHISKAGVNDYFGREISGWRALGLDGSKIYKMLRDPVELAASASSFNRLPLLKKHTYVTADSIESDQIIGAIGSDAVFNDPYLNVSIAVWDSKSIAGIESEQVKEISCAYHYKPDMTPGVFNGIAYDGVMREIKGNHVALVENGRAGHDVIVADSNPFLEKNQMIMTKHGKAIFEAMKGMSKKLAEDAALGAIVGGADKTFDKVLAKQKLIALDSEIDAQRIDNIIDSILGIEDSPVALQIPSGEEIEGGAGDGETVPEPAQKTKTERISSLLGGKVDPSVIEEIMKILEMEDNMAMDAAINVAIEKRLAAINDANQAAREVRKTIGDVDIAMDSSKIYSLALDHLGVDYTGIKESKSLGAIYRAATLNRKDDVKKDNTVSPLQRFRVI